MFKKIAFAKVFLLWVAASVYAQAESIATILVTANKQPETWLDVGNSISVHDRQKLNRAGVRQLSDLAALTPGLDFQPSGQSGFEVPVIRGMSAIPTAFSSSTLLLIDGVPVTTAFGFSDAMLDLERVEVARGPQSSLYGRNADGGVIHLHTRKPGFESEQSLSLRTGSRNLRALELGLDQPLLDDRVALRIAASNKVQDGYVDNLHSGQPEDDRERSAGAGALRWRTGESGEVNLRYRHLRFRDGGAAWGPANGEEGDRTTRATDSWNRSQGDQWSLNVTQALNNSLALESITGWRDYRDRVRQDTDYTPQPLFSVARDYQLQTLSQELRLNGLGTWGSWVLGAYADRNDYDLLFTQQTSQATRTTDVIGENHSQSVFAQVRLTPTDDWAFILGGRVERNRWEARESDGELQDDNWSHWSPSVTVTRALGDHHSTYIRYAEGTRAGGFNLFALSATQPHYEPQTVDSWEWGLKGAGASTRYELSLYRMSIDDMQVQQMTGPGMVLITNAARGRSQGLEFSVSRFLGERWSLDAVLALNDAEHLMRALEGENQQQRRMPFTSPVQGQVSLRYETPTGLYVQTGVSGSRFQYLDPAHQERRNGYARVDMTLGYQTDRWELALYGENLTGRDYHARGLMNGTTTAYSEPLNLGVSLTGRFQ